jgi:hypothetical protein
MKTKYIFYLFGIVFVIGSFAWIGINRLSDEDLNPSTNLKAENAKPIDVLLLFALPASGKSEVCRYLENLSAKESKDNFGIGKTVHLDDFPYVHIMRRISAELIKHGQKGTFFLAENLPFKNPKDWGTLINLVNEDYLDLVNQNKPAPKSAAKWVMNRLDAARTKVGAEPELGKLPKTLRNKIANAIEDDAAKLLKNKVSKLTSNLEGKTVVIEFSRGGAENAQMPLQAPCGYQYSLSQLCPEILEKASVLYIWVTPEESRRKNEARAKPDEKGSNLHHCVPKIVMRNDYGCDDIDWMLKVSGKPNTVKIEAHGNVYHLPLGRFDNRVDKTTFTHKDKSEWTKENVTDLRKSLEVAFAPLTNSQA